VTDDIVTRLRRVPDPEARVRIGIEPVHLLAQQAADEIERLRATGDQLAHSVRVGRWDDALDAWDEIRRG
jgi:hypothetical protein